MQAHLGSYFFAPGFRQKRLGPGRQALCRRLRQTAKSM